MNLCKNEQLYVLKMLLRIERTLDRCKSIIADETFRILPSDDQERYLKMAMKLDSNDSQNLYRKRNLINVTLNKLQMLKPFKHIIWCI